MNLFENTVVINKGAEFSSCGKYRYMLWRKWEDTLPIIAFIGLSPSTANADKNDPTIHLVMSFAKMWGYGSVVMLNLFAIISSKPEILLTCDDPQNNNNFWIEGIVDNPKVKDVVFAWGGFKEAAERAKYIQSLFPNAYCLGKTNSGAPLHPRALVYKKGAAKNPQLIKYNA